jgi:hypothetical protein
MAMAVDLTFSFLLTGAPHRGGGYGTTPLRGEEAEIFSSRDAMMIDLQRGGGRVQLRGEGEREDQIVYLAG